jgi:hypothetical protein
MGTKSHNPFAARQALLVDVMLLLFAVLYFAKVSARVGSVVLVVALLVRWRRVIAAGRWLYRRFFSTGVSDSIDIVLFWNARRAISAVLPVVAAFLLIPGWLIASALAPAQQVAKRDEFSILLAIILVPVALTLVVIAFATWRCPACGHNPGSHPWSDGVRKCAKCRARLQFRQ